MNLLFEAQRDKPAVMALVFPEMQAQAILRARRVEHEQAVAMHRDMRADLLAQEDRRTQTETVDRFLARSRWSSARVGVKSLTQAA